jgi:hypothetical protein
MQKSSFFGTQSLYISAPYIITLPLSKNYKDTTGRKVRRYALILFYLYQISHFASRKIYATGTQQPAAPSP